jgi:hypothetical protein
MTELALYTFREEMNFLQLLLGQLVIHVGDNGIDLPSLLKQERQNFRKKLELTHYF